MSIGINQLLVHLVQENFLYKTIRGFLRGFFVKTLGNSSSDFLDFAFLQVRVEFDLSWSSLSNNLDKNSQLISVLTFNVGKNINQGLSLSDVLLNLISGQLVLVEGSCNSVSLNVFHRDENLLGNISNIEFVLLDVSQTDLQNSSL